MRIPWASAFSPAARITGPSASGSEKGKPSSTMSAPPSTAACASSGVSGPGHQIDDEGLARHASNSEGVLRPRRHRRRLPAAPGWLTAGAASPRAAVRCFVVGVGMVRPRLTHHSAGGSWACWSRSRSSPVGAPALPRLDAPACGAAPSPRCRREPVLVQIRRARAHGCRCSGSPSSSSGRWPYVGLWWFAARSSSFTGLEPHDPRFADFFYYAVSTAFISPPGDIIAHLARGAERDDDRDADGVRAPDDLPVELRRLGTRGASRASRQTGSALTSRAPSRDPCRRGRRDRPR